MAETVSQVPVTDLIDHIVSQDVQLSIWTELEETPGGDIKKTFWCRMGMGDAQSGSTLRQAVLATVQYCKNETDQDLLEGLPKHCYRCGEGLEDWREYDEACVSCDDDICPVCHDFSLHVGHRIYCLNGCRLKWYPHGTLVGSDDGNGIEYTEEDLGEDAKKKGLSI